MLPQEFLNKMKKYLGDEFDIFIDSFSNAPKKAVRVNTLKSEINAVKSCFARFESTPFSPLSFEVDNEKLGENPLHSAGAFYSQEPSASSVVTVLDPKPFDKVLDLCAAPGGKSTQIAACLHGQGLLFSNEIVKSRANILLSNIERMGVRNAVVTSSHPDVICKKLHGFFDKILVDAPCSGEGMFRKNNEAIKEWSLEHVETCAVRQLSILNSASSALREGGILVYSTCTFSKEENEDVCERFLEQNKQFELVSINADFGRKAMGIEAVRIYPMDGGEGHFVAKFRKNACESKKIKQFTYSSNKFQDADKLYKELFFDEVFGRFENYSDKVLILPHNLPDLKGIQVLRAGVDFGEIKAKRIEPSHAVFMAQPKDNMRSVIDFDLNDEALYKFLKGEEIPCENKGYTGVCVNGVSLGFGKASNGVLKNRYPKGLRYKK